jgi:cyclic beta-1,2-glucan synthetase
VIDRPGGIFVRPAEQISSEDRILLQSVARAVITDSRGTLAANSSIGGSLTERACRASTRPRPSTRRTSARGPVPAERRSADVRTDSGDSRRRRRVHHLARSGQTTPAPWANVLANPQFGTVVSESGAAYTWSENAHEFRLTPWHNDPVTRCERRGVLPARRRDGPRLVADSPLPVCPRTRGT